MSYKVEKVLLENDDMIVEKLDTSHNLSYDELLRTNNDQSYGEISNKRKSLAGFSKREDLMLRALDLLSPFDTEFIQAHLPTRTKSEIEYRLNDPQFRVGAAEFKTLPIFLFELIFVRDLMESHKSLMLLTAKKIIPLSCRSQSCQHDFLSIPRARLSYSSRSEFGFEVEDLCNFIAANLKQEYFPYLRRNVYNMEEHLTKAGIDYRAIHPGGIEAGQNKVVVTKDSLKKSSSDGVVRIDASGRVILNEDHKKTLHHIVKAIGKNKWEDATQLLLAVYDSEIDFDAEDVEIYKRVAGYYRLNLDVDQQAGAFKMTEDQCSMYLYRCWSKTLQGTALWSQVARHIRSRTAPQIQNRLSRVTDNIEDVTIDNVKKNCADGSMSVAQWHHDNSHVVSLTIFPKSSAAMDVTTKLQHEVRFLVAGTITNLFMLPCKYTALRCSHIGLEQHKFTYDPEKPAEQFINYVKLTFANALKKAELVDKYFDHHQLSYMGEDIHDIMKTAETERFILPKEDFMRLNRRQVTPGMSPGSPSPRMASPGSATPSPGARGRPRGTPSMTPVTTKTPTARGQKRKSLID